MRRGGDARRHLRAGQMRRATALLAPPTCLPLLLIMASSSVSAFSPPLAPRARLAAAPATAPSLSVAPPPASRAGILRGGEADAEAAASTSSTVGSKCAHWAGELGFKREPVENPRITLANPAAHTSPPHPPHARPADPRIAGRRGRGATAPGCAPTLRCRPGRRRG